MGWKTEGKRVLENEGNQTGFVLFRKCTKEGNGKKKYKIAVVNNYYEYDSEWICQ